MVTSMRKNKTSLPLNLNFAKAYPAIDENKTCPMVVHMYNIEEYKEPSTILESCFNSINTIVKGSNNNIADNFSFFNPL